MLSRNPGSHPGSQEARGRAPAALLCATLGLALVATTGCRALQEAAANRPETPPPPPVPVRAECHVIELSADAQEVTRARVEEQAGVRFRYVPSDELASTLAAQRPERVFVFAHGWMNDPSGGRDFTAGLVLGVFDRARADGQGEPRVAFVGVHWDSTRPVFHESALTAERIGAERVAPWLARLRAGLPPPATVTLVGHSLGARLTLATLQGSAQRHATAACLLEGAASRTALLPDQAAAVPGQFPAAVARTSVLVNVFSSHDDVLRHAYANAMLGPALGLEGADRAGGGERYPVIPLQGERASSAQLDATLASAPARSPRGDGRVVNVDASALVTGHSDIVKPAIFDLIWLATTCSQP